MENSLVGVFEKRAEADAVRKELIDAGFGENSVSVFTEVSQKEKPDALVERVRGWFGHMPSEAQWTFVSVYAHPERIDEAATILRRHRPKDVKWKA